MMGCEREGETFEGGRRVRGREKASREGEGFEGGARSREVRVRSLSSGGARSIALVGSVRSLVGVVSTERVSTTRVSTTRVSATHSSQIKIQNERDRDGSIADHGRDVASRGEVPVVRGGVLVTPRRRGVRTARRSSPRVARRPRRSVEASDPSRDTSRSPSPVPAIDPREASPRMAKKATFR